MRFTVALFIGSIKFTKYGTCCCNLTDSAGLEKRVFYIMQKSLILSIGVMI
jgi:hypothetical protein